jgi:hypothetical protein
MRSKERQRLQEEKDKLLFQLQEINEKLKVPDSVTVTGALYDPINQGAVIKIQQPKVLEEGMEFFIQLKNSKYENVRKYYKIASPIKRVKKEIIEKKIKELNRSLDVLKTTVVTKGSQPKPVFFIYFSSDYVFRYDKYVKIYFGDDLKRLLSKVPDDPRYYPDSFYDVFIVKDSTKKYKFNHHYSTLKSSSKNSSKTKKKRGFYLL